MPRTVPGATTAGLTWYGHATVRLDLGATTLLTNPVLRARLAHLRRHAAAPPVPDDVDAVLVSHAHHDHLDLPSLRRLAGTPTVVVPRGVARALRRVPMPEVVEIDPGERHEVGDVTVHAVEAAHDGRRAAPRTHPAEALGFVIEGAGLRIYFAGDTERFDGMGVVRGPVDVALLPVWGWGPTLGRGHMD